jgi:hypothetical protein
MDRSEQRAGDADRERVAERLRIALEEGRLNLYEYDDRLKDAFAAKTYGELDLLLKDLPDTAPADQQQLVRASDATGAVATRGWWTGPDGRFGGATRRWLGEMWGSWLTANSICVAIWGFTSIMAEQWIYPWPVWVAGPWGIVLVINTVTGLASGEPQRWAAKRARKEAEREVRRRAKRDQADDEE